MSETGFLCSPRTATEINPLDGKSYLSDIQSAIETAGFYPISSGQTTGTVTQTGGDEGTVDKYASTMANVTSSGYAPFVTPTPSQVLANGDPIGFCTVTTSDGQGLAGS